MSYRSITRHKSTYPLLAALVTVVTAAVTLTVLRLSDGASNGLADSVGSSRVEAAGPLVSEPSPASDEGQQPGPLQVGGTPTLEGLSSNASLGQSDVTRTDTSAHSGTSTTDAESSAGRPGTSNKPTTTADQTADEKPGSSTQRPSSSQQPTTQDPTTSDRPTTNRPASTRPPTVTTSTTTEPITTATTITTTTTTTTTPTTAATTAPTPTTTTTTTTPTSTPTTTPTTSPTSTTPPSGGGRVVWQENFDRLDTSAWALEHSTYGDGNNELQCYRPENVSVSGGKLVLRAVTERYTCPNGSTRQVTSGMVRSRGVTFSPGQAIEFRVKLTPANPNDQGGLWPAVWASGWAGGGWPTAGELDWLEVMTAENPNRAMFSMHYSDPSGSHKLQNKGVIGSEYFSNSWHTIRFEYGRNGKLVWFLDGVESFRVESADTIQGYPAPFDQTIGEIKINLALGGRPGPLASGAVGSQGATFEMDYIRILDL